MKLFLLILPMLSLVVGARGAEPTVVPPEPPIEEITKRAESAFIVLACRPNKDRTMLEVFEVLKGEEKYDENKSEILPSIFRSNPKALATKGFIELIFINPPDHEPGFLLGSTLALWPTRDAQIGPQRLTFVGHDYSKVKRAVQALHGEAQQGGAGEPATRSESDSEGGEKPQPQTDGRSQ